jgi:hypothetical protein
MEFIANGINNNYLRNFVNKLRTVVLAKGTDILENHRGKSGRR